MNPDFAQRRRLAIAIAITAILVPAAFLLNRGDDEPEATPAAAAVGTIPGAVTAPPVEAPAVETTPAATDAMGTAPVAYLDGTVPPDNDDPATIAIPRLGQSISGTASFRRDISELELCQVKGVPFNSIVTVTNLDNSRSIQCRAGVGGLAPTNDVVLHADAFVLIADLTDAPVPVEITW